MAEFDNIGIIGLGLLGGSICLAARKSGVAKKVLGYTRTPGTLEKAKNTGLIDKGFSDISRFIEESDFIILCAPVFSNFRYINDIVKTKPEVFFTDVGSTKNNIVKLVDGQFKGQHNFIGSHPIAGSEKKGFDFSSEDMFKGRVVILTPGEKSRPQALSKLKTFWETLGSSTVVMDAGKHDEILAYTSHLPHSVIFALCMSLKNKISDSQSVLGFGTGLKDTTRIGGSDPQIWTEIFIDNKTNILSAIEEFKTALNDLQSLIEKEDRVSLEEYLKNAKKTKEFIEKK